MTEDQSHKWDPSSWELPKSVDDPQWAARRRLAEVIRGIADRCVRADVTPEELDELTAQLTPIRDRMLAMPFKHSGAAFADGTFFDDQHRYVDRGAGIGWSNPMAGPLYISKEDGDIVGRIRCDSRHLGAPGFVHGGIVSLLLDEALGHAAISEGFGVVTARLEVRYKNPTPLHTDLTVHAHLDRVEGRRCFASGRIVADGAVTAEADGVFVHVAGGKFEQIFDSMNARRAGAPAAAQSAKRNG